MCAMLGFARRFGVRGFAKRRQGANVAPLENVLQKWSRDRKCPDHTLQSLRSLGSVVGGRDHGTGKKHVEQQDQLRRSLHKDPRFHEMFSG